MNLDILERNIITTLHNLCKITQLIGGNFDNLQDVVVNLKMALGVNKSRLQTVQRTSTAFVIPWIMHPPPLQV